MIYSFEGETADEVWQHMADSFRSGAFREQPGRGGSTHELLHVVTSISDPRQRWVQSRRPPMNPAFALAEVVWILAGRNDVDFLEFWFSKIRQFIGERPYAYGAYGHRLRFHHGIDQLERAYQALRNNPNSRQVALQIWDAETDLPNQTGEPRSEDIPCNMLSMLKVRDGRLEWFQVIRSNDIYLGVPYNFIQFTMLQEIIAGWLGIGVGTYNQVSDSLHVYDRDAKNVTRSVPTHEEKNSDSIAVSKDISDQLFAELSRKLDDMRNPSLQVESLLGLAEWPSAPQSFKNMLLLLSSEAARRHHWHDLSKGLMAQCTNPGFIRLWDNWIASVDRNYRSVSSANL